MIIAHIRPTISSFNKLNPSLINALTNCPSPESIHRNLGVICIGDSRPNLRIRRVVLENTSDGLFPIDIRVVKLRESNGFNLCNV
jgi:hypothetical protein